MLLDLDAWRAVAHPFYEVFPRRPAAEAGAEVDARVVGELLLSRVSTPHQMLVHDPLTRRAVCHEYLLFERFHSGGGLGEAAETGFNVHPKQLHLIDMSRRYVSSKSASRSEGVLIPHRMLDYDPSLDPPIAMLDATSPKGRLLVSAHELLTSSVRASDAMDIASVFVSMVERFMLGRKRGEEVRERAASTLPFALRTHIEDQLGEAALTPAALCATFGISRSVLYRQFEDEGGVSRYLRNRRLDRCFFELAGAPKTRGMISAVARRWGFDDQNAFLRHFKERFGMPPTACLASGEPPTFDVSSSPLKVATKWLENLQNS